MDPERIIIELDSSKVVSGMGGLSALAKNLEAIEARILAINRATAGMATPARGFKELEGAIKALQTKGGGLDVGSLSGGLNLNQQAFEKFVNQRSAAVQGYLVTMQKFESASKAAQTIRAFEVQQSRDFQKQVVTLPQLMGSTESRPTGGQVHAGVEGQIQLIIPAGQIAARIEGMVNATGGTPAAAGGTPALPKTTGRASKAKEKGELNLEETAGEISRTRTETADTLVETVRDMDEAGNVIATTYDSILGELKQVTTTPTLALLKQRLAQAKALAATGLRTGLVEAGGKDYLAQAGQYETQASVLKQLGITAGGEGTGHPGLANISERLLAESELMSARATASRGKAGAAASARQRAVQEEVSENYAARKQAEQKAQEQREREMAGDEEARQRRDLASRQRFYRVDTRSRDQLAQERAAREKEREELLAKQRRAFNSAQPPLIPPGAPPGKPPGAGGGGGSRMKSALALWTPEGIAANVVKVSGWALAVAILYKSIEAAEHAMERLVEIGGQTARLEQIFRGIGGSAQDLTNDITALASATGRDTDEAMESAIAWSRLGYTRTQVNEATRVSLMAANDAQISAGEATKYLSSITQVYNLSAHDLNGVLGQVVNTANKYNVTVSDLLNGMSKVAPMARQAGLGLSELQGMIGAAVGSTGQTGSMIGNALKTVMVRLSQPENQEYLRRGLGIEALGQKEGEVNPMSSLLDQLATKWQVLTDEERKNLSVRIAGATQATRFVAIMQSYAKGQELAADGLVNLNAAQSENEKILTSEKAQLSGLSSAWDSFIVKQGNAPSDLLGGATAMQTLVTYTEGVKNLINLMNFRIGSTTPGRSPKEEAAYIESGKATTWEEIKYGLGLVGPGGLGKTVGLFNYYSTPKEERAIIPDITEEDKLRGASDAAAIRARHYRSLATGALRNPREEERNAQLEGAAIAMGGPEGRQLEAAIKTNDLMAARTILLAKAAEEDKKQADYRTAADASNARQMAVYQSELKLAQFEQQMATKDSAAEADAKERALAAQAQIDQLTGKRAVSAIPDDEDEPLSAVYETRAQAVSDLMERQKTLAERIRDVYQQMPLQTQSAHLQADMLTMQSQLSLLKEQQATLDKMQDSPQVIAEREQVFAQIHQVQGAMTAAGSSDNQQMAGIMDDRAIAFRRAQAEAAAMHVGPNEAGKLLNEEAGLKRELNKYGGRDPRGLSDNDKARQLEMENQLMLAQQKIAERMIELKGQEKQIMIDANREFQKGLLFAGPGELLKKLAAAQLNKKGVSSGEFFSMDTDIRHTIYDLHGGEAGAMNRWEQRLLAGRTMTTQQEQNQSRASRSRINADIRNLGTGLEGVTGRGDMGAGSELGAGRVAAEMNRCAGSTAALSDAFDRLAHKVNNLGGGGAGSASRGNQTAIPGGGLNTGHALGANGATYIKPGPTEVPTEWGGSKGNDPRYRRQPLDWDATTNVW